MPSTPMREPWGPHCTCAPESRGPYGACRRCSAVLTGTACDRALRPLSVRPRPRPPEPNIPGVCTNPRNRVHPRTGTPLSGRIHEGPGVSSPPRHGPLTRSRALQLRDPLVAHREVRHKGVSRIDRCSSGPAARGEDVTCTVPIVHLGGQTIMQSRVLRPRWPGVVAGTAIGVMVSQFVLASPASAATCTPTITSDGAATVLTFTTVGTCTWEVPAGITKLDAVLIVGGGGGGGFDIGGGGGAGGLVDRTNVALTAGSILTIVVGAGGAGATNYSPTAGTNSGKDSSFDGVVALGGGYGGSGSVNGASGGSGGGAGYAAGAARTGGSALQSGSAAGGSGSNGGASPAFPFLVDTGGGGGGAGGAGGDSRRAGCDYGGSGGTGVARTITGTSTYYAGGGGGGSAATVALGGSGVGGDGGTTGACGAVFSATAGAARTGSGGGGGKNGEAGGAGGSGVVILRYGAPAVAAPVPPSWFQSIGRPSQVDSCPVGWWPSWAQWPNGGTGGWVCSREIFWDPVIGAWSHRSAVRSSTTLRSPAMPSPLGFG